MFVKMGSWHIVKDDFKTVCGRSYVVNMDVRLPSVKRPKSAELPLDEKSCETCLRLHEALLTNAE